MTSLQRHLSFNRAKNRNSNLFYEENHHAKFHQNPMKESGVIKLRRIPPPPPPRLNMGMESPKLDRVKWRKYKFYLKNMHDGSTLHFRPCVSNYDRRKCITLELYLILKLLAGEDAVFQFEFSFTLTLLPTGGGEGFLSNTTIVLTATLKPFKLWPQALWFIVFTFFATI